MNLDLLSAWLGIFCWRHFRVFFCHSFTQLHLVEPLSLSLRAWSRQSKYIRGNGRAVTVVRIVLLINNVIIIPGIDNVTQSSAREACGAK